MSGFNHQPFLWPATSDPLFPKTALLLHFEGANTSQTLVDSSSYADTGAVSGAYAYIANPAGFAGTGSLRLNAAVPGGAQFGPDARFRWDPADGMTVEWMFNDVVRQNVTESPSLFRCYDGAGIAIIEVALYSITPEVSLRFDQTFNDFRQYTYTPHPSGWNHLAVCLRPGGGGALWVNEVKLVERSAAEVRPGGGVSGDPTLIVGSWQLTEGASLGILCFMDEFRWTNHDRYPTACPYPSGAFPNY